MIFYFLFSGDETRFANLYTEENVSALDSLFSQPLLYPSWVDDNKKKYDFCTTMMLNNIGLAMKRMQTISSIQLPPQDQNNEQ